MDQCAPAQFVPACLHCYSVTVPFASQVMPTKDSFDAVMYLAIMHGDTALADLKLGHQNLNFEATERTGQLKSLVRLSDCCLFALCK